MAETAGKPAVSASEDELVTAVYDAVIAARMSFPCPAHVCLLGNSAELELEPAVELLTMPRKQLRAELTLFSVVMSQIEVTASEIGLAGCSGEARGALARHPVIAYGSGAGLGSPCLRHCEKPAALSAACTRSFTRESFSKSANGLVVSMRPSS